MAKKNIPHLSALPSEQLLLFEELVEVHNINPIEAAEIVHQDAAAIKTFLDGLDKPPSDT